MATDKLVDFDHVTDFISREAAWNGIYNCPTKTDADGYIWVRTKDVAHMIDDVPAADVQPVVRGRWDVVDKPLEKATICECSECKHRIWMYDGDDGWNYCPHCGADMRPEGKTKE